jgi:hypothetical protein
MSKRYCPWRGARRNERRGTRALFDARQERVVRVVLVLEIEPRLQADIDPARHQPERDVRRLHPPVPQRHAPRLHGMQGELASLAIRREPAETGDGRIGPVLSGKDARRVGLPAFQHDILERPSRGIEDGPRDRHRLALRAVADRVEAKVLGIDALHPGEGRDTADMHIRARRLAGRFVQKVEFLHHGHIPSGRFSNIVWRRPLSTMSKR